MQKDNETWGDPAVVEDKLAHRDSNMTCYACHTSWVTSCFGCHLSMEANRKMPNRHNEGGDSRNFTSYNYQVIRDDIFMLGRDGTVTGHRVAPVRSSSAVLVSSRNQNREWIYHQQQTVSAEGFSGQTFNTHVPHTVRGKEIANLLRLPCIRRRATTTPGSRRYTCRGRISSILWAATSMWRRARRSKRSP